MNFKRAFMLGVLSLACMAASAQWLWIDQDGRKVYSDSAPPPDTPLKNILKQPGGRTVPQEVAPTTISAASGAASAARPTGKNKELEDKRKQAEQAEDEKHRAETEKQKQLKADNCRRARQAKASLDSGVRIATTNDKGEREFLDDGARAAETKRMQEAIQSQCQ
jgi:hypothetical protein